MRKNWEIATKLAAAAVSSSRRGGEAAGRVAAAAQVRRQAEKPQAVVSAPVLEVVTGVDLNEIPAAIREVAAKLKRDRLEEARNRILLPGSDTSHVELKDSDGSDDVRGKFYISDGGWRSELRVATPMEVLTSTVVATGGLDFDTMPHIGALRKSMRSMIDAAKMPHVYTGDNKVSTGAIKPVFYVPDVTKRERYGDLEDYSLRKIAYASPVQKIVVETVLPRILISIASSTEKAFPDLEAQITEMIESSNGGKKIPGLQEKISELVKSDGNDLPALFGFSAGCRDNIMVENYVREFCKSHKWQAEDISSIFSLLNCVHIGHSIDWSLLKEGGFARTTFLSVEDFGVKEPPYVNGLIAHSMEGNSQPYKKYELEGAFHELLYLFAIGAVPVVSQRGTINYTGHSLPHYVEAIVKHLPVSELRAVVAPMVETKSREAAIKKCGGTEDGFLNHVAERG